MKSARLVFLTASLLPFALPAATPGSVRAAPAADQSELTDLTSLREKAERGNAVAQYNLGLAHLQGRQTPVNLLEAYAWLTLAAEGGSTGRALETVLDALTPEQLAAARRRLDTLRAQNPYLRLNAVEPASKPVAPAVPIIGQPVTPVRPAPASTPIIAIPPASPSPDVKRLHDQVAALDQEKRQLTAELNQTRNELAQLKSQLAGRAAAGAEVSNLQTQLRETQAALAQQTNALAAARAEASGVRTELARLQSQLAAAQEQLTARASVANTAAEAVAALERERTAHAATRTDAAQLKTRIDELEDSRSRFERDAAARTSAAERAQGIVADEAKKLSERAAELLQKTDSLAGELNATRAELTETRQTLAATEEKHAATRAELARTMTALEAANTRAQSAAALQADSGAQSASQLSALRTQVSALERDLQDARTAANRSLAEKATAEVALADANRKLAESSRSLSALRQQMSDLGRQQTASSDEKVASLQARLDETHTRLAAAEEKVASRDAELATLRRTIAAAEARPAVSPADLEAARRLASETRDQLAAANRELETVRPHAAMVRELEARIRQLEADKAALAHAPAGASAVEAEIARLRKAHVETEDKLSTALRSYTLVARERDELQARVADLSGKFSHATQALSSAEAEARAALESAAVSVASTAELETLRNRAAAAERAAETARTELSRANQLLAALRPGYSEPTRPQTAPAGEPARTHTIAPGETLSSIALRYYGTAARWNEILAANRDVLVDERSFAVGRTLRIP